LMGGRLRLMISGGKLHLWIIIYLNWWQSISFRRSIVGRDSWANSFMSMCGCMPRYVILIMESVRCMKYSSTSSSRLRIDRVDGRCLRDGSLRHDLRSCRCALITYWFEVN
jgi:hypothetical protein